MRVSPLVILIGLRGSGKSTLGQALAARLGRSFIDLDERTMARFDEATVAEIWRTHGEGAWRTAETEALAEAIEAGGESVLSLGGGTTMIEDARRRLDGARSAGRARLIYLRLRPDELIGRLRDHEGDRPSLTGGDVAEETRQVFAERDPVYSAIADVVYEPTGEGVDADTERLLRLIEHAGRSS